MERKNSESPPESGKAGLAKTIGKALGSWLPVVLLTLGSLWVIQGALAHTAGHGVIVQGANYDVGTVKEGAVVDHDIRLINLSDQPVTINAEVGCGCTIADAPVRPILPLRLGNINVRIDTHGMKVGPQQRGLVLLIHSNGRAIQRVSKIKFDLK